MTINILFRHRYRALLLLFFSFVVKSPSFFFTALCYSLVIYFRCSRVSREYPMQTPHVLYLVAISVRASSPNRLFYESMNLWTDP